MKRIACQHCHQEPATMARGLGYRCYQNPAVRALYPPTSKFCNRGVANGVIFAAPLPPCPTGAQPGSPEKVLILTLRAACEEQLHHPGDLNYRRRTA